MRPPCRPPHDPGLSLLELLTVWVVVGVLAAAALPSLRGLLQLRQLESASADVAHILRQARELSSARGQALRLEFEAAGGCLLLHTGSTAACRGCVGPAVCQGSAELLARTPALPEQVTLRSTTVTQLWHPAGGTVTPTATIRLTTAEGLEVQHVVNLMGRVRSCASPTRLHGHGPC